MCKKVLVNYLYSYIYIFLMNIISVILGIYIYLKFDNRIEILGAILATGLSISLSLAQYNIENDKMFKELFREFNNKYDCKFNNELNEIDRKFKLDDKFIVSKDEDKNLIIDYLNFCAEEYLWYTKGRIPYNVWKSWRNGMLYFFKLTPIKEIIISQSNQKESFYGLFENLKNDFKI